MPVQVPLQPVPAQQLQIVLGGQNCQIAVYLRGANLYVDVNSNGADISTGVLAMNMVPLVPCIYFGFAGNLVFIDTQGTSDPVYTGLGSRYQLLYLTAADYAQLI
jgi:hypothetical protein